MVSKSRKQRQVKKAKRESGNTEPVPITTSKSVHLKKTRPNMKGKMKIRMGHQSADIYENFENKGSVAWRCPTCNAECRVVGFCVKCEAAKVAPPQEDAPNKMKTTVTGKMASVEQNAAMQSSHQGVKSSKVAKASGGGRR